jgi:hypothetical protein
MTMAMSTQTLDNAASQLEYLLVDSLQLYTVGDPVTTGINVTRSLTPLGAPLAGLVQTTTLLNAVESRTDNTYAIKTAKRTPLAAGQAVKVLSCAAEPELVGKTLLVDKVSMNGLSLLRKAVASDYTQVNQEGKGALQ